MNKTSILEKDVTLLVKENAPLMKHIIGQDQEELTIKVEKNVTSTMVAYLHEDIDAKFKLNIFLEENASFKLYNIVTSSKEVKIDINCTMNDKRSNFENLSVILASENSKINSRIDVLHNALQTTSNTEIYAIAKDNAKIEIDNNATIKKGCSLSVAHQKAKGLTLNKSSMIKALPNLFIDEYDVIANHAASIGSLNPDDLFYLMSRGLTKEEASKIIIMGFINPLIECIDDADTKEMILNNFVEKTSIK